MKTQCDLKSDLNKTVGTSQTKWLEDTLLSEARHTEAYDDFRLFSSLFFIEENLAECHVFFFSQKLSPYIYICIMYINSRAKRQWKMHAILCLSNIITIVANINSGEWLMFKIESHSPHSPSLLLP